MTPSPSCFMEIQVPSTHFSSLHLLGACFGAENDGRAEESKAERVFPPLDERGDGRGSKGSVGSSAGVSTVVVDSLVVLVLEVEVALGGGRELTFKSSGRIPDRSEEPTFTRLGLGGTLSRGRLLENKEREPALVNRGRVRGMTTFVIGRGLGFTETGGSRFLTLERIGGGLGLTVMGSKSIFAVVVRGGAALLSDEEERRAASDSFVDAFS